MTTAALTTPAATTPGGPRSGGPHGLTWATLRVHRSALLVWGVYVLGLAGWLLWLRLVTLPSVRDEAASCGAGGCVDLESAMTYSTGVSMVSTLIAYLTYGVAAWAGASLTGRELERGTAQLAWTQSVTPIRWLATKLAVPAVVLALGTSVLVLLFRWVWSQKEVTYGYEWYYPDPMVALGPMTVAYALCGLAVGALAGVALKRALPALAVAFGFMLWFHVYLDRRTTWLWPTERLTGSAATKVPNNAQHIDLGVITQSGSRADSDLLSCFGAETEDSLSACMADHDITGLYADIHPPSHFWPLHLMATGVVLTVTALATATAFWLLRRRTAR
ncbi:ABC transporter permease [Streptomyces ipomoeae]|uniref:ABC transporter permease n=1 Tax=Streptomyces ipomoeae TaxID=103232 RepID=A0AAE8VV15_9ACTN|nr:ABC transporter permease [Streptomyces ipomoeae]TQE20482.1 ABC transporter permease [Streptomyces ipomoeae]